LINRFIQNADGTSKLPGSDYYRFFTVLMLVAAVAYTIISVFYKGKTYIQDEKA
jgi:POT family proton-dependent oligopeptide transporter